MSFSPHILLDILQACPPTPKIWVAYSGGVDSHVLLHALVQLRDNGFLFSKTSGIAAIHIHHGLHPQAEVWLEHCQTVCQKLDVSCETVRVCAHAKHRESPEAKARQVRYEALIQQLAQEEVLLTAHHEDDQAETVLLQLLRGSGVAGLSAMPQLARLGPGWIMRPLLGWTRAQLHRYAQKERLHWIEDPSNHDIRFDRNFLRHEVIPQLRRRWPAMNSSLSRSAQHMAQANDLMIALAQQDLSFCQDQLPEQLNLPLFLKLSVARQHNVLKYWFKHLGLSSPNRVHIQAILDELIPASEDRQPVVKWPGTQVCRFRHALFAMPTLPPLPKKSLSIPWEFPVPLSLPWGRLIARPSFGKGLLLSPQLPLQVRFRQGGEICYWRGHHHEVKKLLQEVHIPPWQRPFIPLIYLEKTLIAIPGIGIFHHVTNSSQDHGWKIQWEQL